MKYQDSRDIFQNFQKAQESSLFYLSVYARVHVSLMKLNVGLNEFDYSGWWLVSVR